MNNFSKHLFTAFLALGSFFAAVNFAAAADGDIIITVTDKLSSPLSGATFNFFCGGGTEKSVTDGGADDGDGTVNGVISVSTSSAQSEPDCDDGETFATKDVEKDGYVTVTAPITTYSTSAENTTSVSLEFGYKVTIFTADNIPFHSAMVTAGKGSKVDCIEDGNAGIYYCPIPTSDKNKVIKVERDFFQSTTGQFPDIRKENIDPQIMATITGIRYKKIENIGVSIPGADRHTIGVSWTPTTDPNFGKYEVHRKETSGGVTHENSTLSIEVFDREATSTLISAAGCNERNHFVVYVIDADGNRSIISDEVNVTSGGCSGNPTPPPEVVVEEAEEAEVVVAETVVEEELVQEEPAPQPTPAPQLTPPPEPVLEPEPTPPPSPPNPPVPPNPPAQPETPTPRRGGVAQFLNNVTSNYAAVVDLIRERISQGFNLRESIRSNMALLFDIFR